MSEISVIHFGSVLVLLFNAYAVKTLDIRARVSKGDEVDVDEFPFVVNLKVTEQNDEESVGVGCLITKNCVLTTAHNTAQAVVIRVCGGDLTYQSGKCSESAKIVVPDNYTDDNDVAIIVLKEPLEGDHIRQVQLDFNEVKEGETLEFVGWGNGKELKGATFKVEPYKECPYASLFCYRDTQTRQSTEKGDVGGPLLRDKKQVGVHMLPFRGHEEEYLKRKVGVRLSAEGIKSFIIENLKTPRQC